MSREPLPQQQPLLGALCRRLVWAIAEETKAELAAQGFGDVRPAHNAVFALVAGGVGRVTDMAAALGMTKQAVTLMVDHLEAGGYLKRAPDPDDGRAKVVRLSRRGRAAAAVSAQTAAGLDRRWEQTIGRRRLDECKAALAELVDAAAGTAPRQ